MNKIALYIFLISIFTSPAYTQIITGGGGARSASLGNASCTISDGFSLFNNQAGLADVKNISAWVFSERKFFETNLNFSAGGVVLPTNSGTFGVQVNYFGYDLYNQKKIGVAYGRKFSNAINGGLQLDYVSTSIFETGHAGAITFEAGVQVKVSKQITMAMHLFNPVRIKTGFDANETYPTVIKAGFNYKPSDKVLLVTEINKDIDYKASIRAGVEYLPISKLALRAGFKTQPYETCFGAGINLDQLKIDLSSSYHPQLGFTPCLSLCYTFNRNKK